GFRPEFAARFIKAQGRVGLVWVGVFAGENACWSGSGCGLGGGASGRKQGKAKNGRREAQTNQRKISSGKLNNRALLALRRPGRTSAGPSIPLRFRTLLLGFDHSSVMINAHGGDGHGLQHWRILRS